MQAEKLLEQIIEYFGYEFTRVNEEMTHLQDFSGLTFAQIGYLETISRLGHPSVTDLALTLKISKPSVTVAVQKLCAGGYLKKVNSCLDKRSWHIHLNSRFPKDGRIKVVYSTGTPLSSAGESGSAAPLCGNCILAHSS